MTLSAQDFSGWQAGTWAIDPTHSEVTFQIRHLAISKVRGNFEQFSGTIVTGDAIEDTKIEAAVEVKSINTNQAQRDEHLRTSDFFAADEFPQLTFVSTGVRAEDDDILIDGDLTMRGVTRPVTFRGELGGFETDGWGNRKLGFSARTKIIRKDFGLTYNAATESGGLLLGEDVTISIEAQAALQA